jgi:DNA modification methylase
VTISLLLGDCLEQMAALPDSSIDSIVTDPPYGLSFMGKKWDYGVPSVDIWKECLRVLKPGGHLLAFAGTRTQHRMATNIEDAGFEIRDMIAWVYGSGFPKSMDVSKAIDKAAGAEREVVGINEDYLRRKPNGMKTLGATAYGYSQAQQETDARITAPATPEAQQWAGWGTALKPSLEPVTVARKPIEGTVAANVLQHGCGGLNVDGCRVGTERLPSIAAGQAQIGTFERGLMVTPEREGRWPANLIHDGSDEVVRLFPQSNSNATPRNRSPKADRTQWRNGGAEYSDTTEYGDTGSAARFFYCAKTSKRERGEGNTHPTVKPIALMRYLCRLVTPASGIVLDPFMGSGSTGIAALQEGFSFIGIERELEYMAIAQRRIEKAEEELTSD